MPPTDAATRTDWLERIVESPSLAEIADRAAGGARLSVRGLWGSSGHLAAGAIHRRTGCCVLLVLPHLDDADEAIDDLRWFDGLVSASLPALEVMPGETNVSVELLAERLEVAERLAGGERPGVVVAPIQALMQAVPEAKAMPELVRVVSPGEEVDVAELGGWLAEAGYDRVEAIEAPGEFAIRGGIIDIFPPGSDAPIRLDLFGDQVEAIASVNLDTMGSVATLPQARLINAGVDTMRDDERTRPFWDLLPDRTISILADPLEIAEQARGYFERLTDPRGIYSPPAVFKQLAGARCVELTTHGATTEAPDATLPVERLPHFSEQAGEALDELAALARGSAEGAGRLVTVTCGKAAERDRLAELLRERDPEAAGLISLEVGYLYRGFLWGEADASGQRDAWAQRGGGRPRPIALVPHHELFHRYATRRRLRRVASTGFAEQRAETFFDIDVGDYVVHRDHGIAVFRGLRTMRKDGVASEYLTLEFAGRAKLHVPASQIEQVQKYIGGFAGRPKLSKLGGKRWKKQKEDVAEAVRDLAAELLRVHAARQSTPGIAFPEDDAWMRQFEEEFPYEETDDQLAAIAATKRDMMGSRPMDRLICGDVGFGKTEVAMRAAFKAVEAGRQVAVLCPTTVLCEQHERTFRQRVADYPVRVESLSRFKSPAEARAVLADAAAGQVDIVVGTHRLLSEDVHFANLGLVVIDEEQRFGVEHKNKLMRFRLTVDVMTLSATPIPRTLHMAMLGLRDISSLSTPPADRRAIVTELLPFDRQRVRNAILREINRGGQCFFVHNRVHNIHAIANDLRSLVPEASFIVGHGQMKPRELERVMLRFIRGDADVLVSTTIIESGIDIPTANTMFIAEADRFGLAELHQLRGRVGRYKHRAYCYLLLPETRVVSDVAFKRLRAVEQFSMLGAGFKIAMRDMEIRGAGNILGPQQSGHIAAVGYQLYCQLLEEATARLKHEPIPTRSHAHVGLQVGGQFPRDYIASDKHRMEAYRRVGQADDLDAVDAARRDMTQAYGEPPDAAERLFQLAEIRLALTRLGVQSLLLEEQDLVFTTPDSAALDKRLDDAPGSVRLVDEPTKDRPGTIYYRPPANYLDPPSTLLAVLRKLLVRPMRNRPEASASAAESAST